MSDEPMKADPLDTDFHALKAQATPLEDDLMARVMADADAVQMAFLVPKAPLKAPLSHKVLALIGGWPSVAGLATAGVAGIWIGVSQPTALIAGSQTLLYGDTSGAFIDLDPGFGLVNFEGG